MTTGDDTAASRPLHETFTGADGRVPGADWDSVRPGAGFTPGPAVPAAPPPGTVASIIIVLHQVVPMLRPAMLAEMPGVPAAGLRDVAVLLREISEEIDDVAGGVEAEARHREASDG